MAQINFWSVVDMTSLCWRHPCCCHGEVGNWTLQIKSLKISDLKVVTVVIGTRRSQSDSPLDLWVGCASRRKIWRRNVAVKRSTSASSTSHWGAMISMTWWDAGEMWVQLLHTLLPWQPLHNWRMLWNVDETAPYLATPKDTCLWKVFKCNCVQI